jgi:succinate dehydrogenase/fumarate reductase flavoprotein subunit
VNEKIFENIRVGAVVGLACFVLGGIAGSRASAEKSSGEIALLNQRYDTLNRDYTERQRIVEEQQRSLGQRVDECLGYVENAGAIIERTGANASRAVSNLREASDLIRAGIEERKNLEIELDNLRSGLYGIRDMDRVEVE